MSAAVPFFEVRVPCFLLLAVFLPIFRVQVHCFALLAFPPSWCWMVGMLVGVAVVVMPVSQRMMEVEEVAVLVLVVLMGVARLLVAGVLALTSLPSSFLLGGVVGYFENVQLLATQ